MREIKFRVFCKSENRMLSYEHLKEATKGMVDVANAMIEKRCIRVTKPSPYGLFLPLEDEDLEFMQFTGLHDKNGKEIYEGDIVHCWDTIAKCEIWAVVEFGNPNAEYTWGWQLRKIKGNKGVNLDILCWVECEETNAYCEIIGNIYDNPELLKGE